MTAARARALTDADLARLRRLEQRHREATAGKRDTAPPWHASRATAARTTAAPLRTLADVAVHYWRTAR